MHRNILLRTSVVLILSGILLYGCTSGALMMGKIVKPEESKHYEPRGVLVALAIDREQYVLATTMMVMMKGTASFTIFTPDDRNYIILDVPYECKGIARTGVIIDPQLPMDWFYNTCDFKLETNKINYIGRFILIKDISDLTWDKMIVTNALASDKNWFLEYYPAFSNIEFVSVPVTNGLFRTE